MKPQDYDFKVAQIIKTLRESNHLMQKSVAYDLKIDQSTYSRIEKGELAMTVGQLKHVATIFKKSHLQVIALADSQTDSISSESTSIIEIIEKLLLLLECGCKDISIKKSEFDLITCKIREKYVECAISEILNSKAAKFSI